MWQKAKCQLVIGWIEANASTWKGADLPMVFHCRNRDKPKNVSNQLRWKARCLQTLKVLIGCHLEIQRQFSNWKLPPDIKRVMKCLSRMKGNFHVRFLEGLRPVTVSGYSVAASAIQRKSDSRKCWTIIHRVWWVSFHKNQLWGIEKADWNNQRK